MRSLNVGWSLKNLSARLTADGLAFIGLRRAGPDVMRLVPPLRQRLGLSPLLAGDDLLPQRMTFEAFCRQAGLARCDTLSSLCETLKVFHGGGVLPGRKVLIMGASGGDMAMTADVARNLELDFAAIPAGTGSTCRAVRFGRRASGAPA